MSPSKTAGPSNRATRSNVVASGRSKRNGAKSANEEASARPAPQTSRHSAPPSRPTTPSVSSAGRNGGPDPAIGGAETKVPTPGSDHHLAALVTDQDPSLSDMDAAVLITQSLAQTDDGWEVVLPAVVEYVRNRRRYRVRRVEDHLLTFVPGDGTRQAVNPVGDLSLSQLAEFADEYVAIPGRGRVRAGEVTTDEWELRVDDYRERAHELLHRVAFYERVRATLQHLRVDTIDAALKRRHRRTRAAR